MRRISDHLSLATSTIISNTWLLEHEGKKWLVDAGHPLERPGLLLALWRAGVRKKGDLAGVLLTHRHSDHAGNARWLRDRFGCQVACHEDDARALRGDIAPPKMSNRGAFLVHELLCRIEDRFPARCPVDETWRDGRLQEAVLRGPAGARCKVRLGDRTAEIGIPPGGVARLDPTLRAH